MSAWNLGQNDPPEELITMKNQLASKESQIASYQTQLMRKSTELDELKKTFEDAIHKLSHETQRALELEENVRQRDADLTQEKLARQNMEAAMNAANREHKDANLEIRNLQSLLDSITQDSRSQQQRSQQLEKEKETLQERVKELQLASTTTTNEPTKPKGGHRRSSSLSSFRVTALEQELREARATLQKRDDELRTLSNKLTTTREETMRVENEKSTLERTLSARIEELQACVEEKEEEMYCLRDQTAGNDREQELLDRIDEDEAKISALESMLRATPDITSLQRKIQATEAELQRERRNAQRVGELNNQLSEEKELLLHELQEARREKGMSRGGQSDHSSSSSAFGERTDTSQPLPPTGHDGVDQMGQLFATIQRLRSERDDLLRRVEFLESESRFTIEALEAKLSASVATTESPHNTAGTLTQMKLEMDSLHSELSAVQSQASHVASSKNKAILRLNRAVVALGLTVGHLSAEAQESKRANPHDNTRVTELEEKLASTILSLETVTCRKDEIADALQGKEGELEAARFGQQQATRTVQDLSSRINTLTNQLDMAESQRDSFATQIDNLERELSNSRKELAQAEERYSDLQFNQLNSMSSSEATTALRNQIRELEMRIMRRNEQIGVHQHDVRRLETNLRLQEERLTEMTQEMEMLNAQKDAMVEDCANTREERDGALHRLEDLEEEIVGMEEKQAQDEEAITALIGIILETCGRARQAIQEQTASTQDAASIRLAEALEMAQDLKAHVARMEDDAQARQRYSDELAREITTLQTAREAEIAHNTSLQKELGERTEELHGQIRELQQSADSTEVMHRAAVERLNMEAEQLRNEIKTLREITSENNNAQSSQRDEGTIASFQLRISELEGQLSQSEMDFNRERATLTSRLEESLSQKLVLEGQLEELRAQLSELGERHANELTQLRQSMTSTAEASSQSQIVLEQLEGERTRLSTRVEALESQLASSETQFSEQRQGLNLRIEGYQIELANLAQKLSDLSSRLDEEKDARSSERRQYLEAEEAYEDANRRNEARLEELDTAFSTLNERYATLVETHHSVEQEKTELQEQTTSLLAKLEQNKSVERVLQDQIDAREEAISALKADLCKLEGELARTEQLNAKTNLSLSLAAAQHKRETTELHRELENLRSRSNLEQVIVDLEERNQEMDALLRQKCTEIEENDDKALELLKENKKLSSKADALGRKLGVLQAKLAKLKAQAPKQEPSRTPEPHPAGQDHKATAEAGRQPLRSMTTSISLPTFSAPPSVFPSSSSTPAESSRAASFSLQPRTAQSQAASPPNPMPMRKPGNDDALAPSPSSIVGKKRRAPDDFETCEPVPPQVFTAESIPTDEGGRTPRVRRMLTSLQSGFTPIRNAARPMMPMPSPKRPTSQPSPFISDVTNSPLVVPPLNPGLESAKSKRSWLGKIRGASSSTSTHGTGR
ncbi:hypothetical protein BKA70DRAFT_1486238 [Coprinopsis sp. MPI-PUGE-AT-0042]|nr:hypothetical protein BKA70DRAFT_1486238 [Coprinopsis sp. MPI-PUGE-AT-0042]